jgi:hypothetical protein
MIKFLLFNRDRIQIDRNCSFRNPPWTISN